MPAMANITVKKDDGTTDVTYTALNPSGGDTSQALWRGPGYNTGYSAAAGKPSLTLASSWNGPRTARKLQGKFQLPEVITDASGVPVSTNSVILAIDAVIPQGMTSSAIAEAVSQGMNLFASALIKDSAKAGFSPT